MSRWNREALCVAFQERVNGLDKARELADMPNKRQRGSANLESERETRQRQRDLDRFRIDRAAIHGIRAGRTSMLASYGIETAADIKKTKIMQIPGFGEALTSDLLIGGISMNGTSALIQTSPLIVMKSMPWIEA